MKMTKDFVGVEWIGPERELPPLGVKKPGDRFEVLRETAVDLKQRNFVRLINDSTNAKKPAKG